MIVQIYDVASVDEALRVAGLKADHIGVVVGTDGLANETRPFKAKEIFMSLPHGKKGVAIANSSDISEIRKIITESEPDIIHLTSHLEEILPEDLELLKKDFPSLEIMQTIPVIGEESVVAALMYGAVADYLLLETKDPKTGQVGSTGETHDWELDKKIVQSVSSKVISGGGLGPENVVRAIEQIRPYGVHSKTMTNKIGKREKDIIKVKMFVDRAKHVTL